MAWRWLSTAMLPAVAVAVTVTGEVLKEAVYQQAVVDAHGNIESVAASHMRREASPARPVASELEIAKPEPIALNLMSAGASASATKLSTDALLQDALLSAEQRLDAQRTGTSQSHQMSALQNPLSALPHQLPQGSVYYFDPEADALNYLGSRGDDKYRVATASLAENPPAHLGQAQTIWTQRGPKGRRGPRGLPGQKGPMGPKGIPGTDFHSDIDLSKSRGKPGPAGPLGPPGDHGVHGDRGPPGPAGAKGAQGNFTREQELEFASLTRRMATALQRADAMDEMEHLVLTTRLNRLKSHFDWLEKNLTAEEDEAKKQRDLADEKMKEVESINAVTENASAAVAEAKAAEKNLLKREAKLKDEILTITQEQQQVMNAPLPPGYEPAPCPPANADRRKHYHR